jgi:1,4-dihydroxy-2-naphthoate octaprenyltransferase
VKFQQWVLENTIEQRLLGYSKVMNKWIQGARPRTLPAAIAPVLTASALAYHQSNKVDWLNALLALLVGVALQIGVNYSNDYSDGIKGSDTNRVGPIRLVGSGLASANSVKNAALFTYLLGAIFGTIFALRTNWILLLIGVVAIAAAWFYTGGDNPYGYRGLGEISVFIFFGLVATIGTYYGETKSISTWSVLLGVEMGLLACAILAVNNLRDLPKDSLVGKRTLAVRLGDSGARKLLIGLLLVSLLIQLIFLFLTPMAILPVMMAPFGIRIVARVRSGAKGADLIPTLGAVARVQMLASLWIAIALIGSKP